MAKRFAGFKSDTLKNKILPALGYSGPVSDKAINAFLASNPAAAAKMGKYTLAARRAIEGQQVRMAEGGAISLQDRLAAQARGFTSANQQALINQANIAFRSNQAPVQAQVRTADVPLQQAPSPQMPVQQEAPAQPVPMTRMQQLQAMQQGLTQTPEYMAMQEYQQNTAPNALDQNRMKELQAAFEGTDMYNQFRQAEQDFQTSLVPITPSQPRQLPPQAPQQGSGQVPPHTHTISMARGGVIYAADGVDVQNDEEENQEEGTTDTTTGTPMGSASKMTKAITADPRKLTVKADVVKDTGTGTDIAEGTGQAGDAQQADVTQAGTAAGATAAPSKGAAQVETVESAGAVDKALDLAAAAVGTVSDDAKMKAAQSDPNQLAQLELEAAQGEAATVQGAPTRKLETGELIDGSAVDQQRVKDIYGDKPLEAATVQGELADLMEDFDGGKTPPWAAGAMRNANAMLAARGIGASSMAGMAVVQAAMEAALPIAQMDASNKQQVAIESARQRANFLQMEFTQEFQTKVQNAARISEIANMNFNADQQVALENARMAQTMNLANLSNRQAKVMADAAAMSQVDMANLNNRQQAAVQNAQAFLQMDMTNLSNEQQMNMFKAQERVNSILSDTAAENAARQFNATSENQTNQFFASLATQVSQFNAEQQNAMSRFNAGEANALAQFNTAQANAREQFNATNHLVVAQANAQWAQSITTAANAANNQANRDAALAANNLTMTAYNNIVQRERDTLAWAWQSGENAAQRDANIAIAKINAEASASAGGDTDDIGLSAASGTFLGQLAINAADFIFNK